MSHFPQFARRIAAAALIILASAAAAPAAAAARRSRAAAPSGGSAAPARASCPGVAGLSLAAALDQFRECGLELIFSSELVRPEMRVTAEPPDGPPRRRLDALLAPFGLAAIDGPAGTILIVPAPDDGRAGDRRKGRARSTGAGGRPILRERVRVESSSDERPETVRTVGAQEMAALPTPGDDAGRLIASLPGTAAADRGARFGIRGGSGDGALVVLDGLRIDEPYHLQDFSAFSSLLDSRAVDRLDLMSGIFPAEYGGRLSGVVDISTTDPESAPRSVLGVSTINRSLLSTGPLGAAGGWMVSARSWLPDRALDTVTVDGEALDPTYGDLLGKTRWRLPGGSLLTAHVLASRDELAHRTDAGDGRATAEDDHRYAWVTLETPWSPRLYSETVFSGSRVARRRDGGTTPVGGAIQIDDTLSYGGLGLKQDWIFDAASRTRLQWGFEARRFESEYEYSSRVDLPGPPPDGLPTIPGGGQAIDRNLQADPQGREVGAYVAGRFPIAGPATLDLGVRQDRQTLTGETETSPRAEVTARLGPRSTLRAGWGMFSQPQAIQELAIEDGVTQFFRSERATRREIGFEHRYRDGPVLDVSAYLTDTAHVRPYYENLFDPFDLFPEAQPDRVLVAPASSRARGIEIGLRSAPGGRWGWRAWYALATAEDRIDGAWVARSWDQRHTFNLDLDYHRDDRWQIGLAGVYHTGWPTTEVRAEPSTAPDGSLVITPILGPRNADRYAPYHRVDLQFTRTFHLGGGRLGLHLQILNLYGRRNPYFTQEFRYLPRPDGSVEVQRIEGHGLRQLPQVGLTYEF